MTARVILLLTVFFLSLNLFSQKGELPSVDVQNKYGESYNTDRISNDGKPIILSFWATWCKPCIKELSAIQDVYPEWREETGVKVVAVSIDNARSTSKVLPMVNGNGWEYEILLDPNGDFKRAMGVNTIPHTFILNGDGEVVWQHTSYSEGSEHQLIEKVRKLNRGESLD
ncbi:MAG: TlpA family protein disulfide reductase [Bacteroidales bacterium]|nr:TlpA family protein disulfide reductase [Bacteroidales bacterium]MCF8332588.1 TlpA family protein disulfide reductase [Bacteroidales bacterium]